MHIWYRAVCDEHQEMIDVLVNNPARTAIYLSEEPKNSKINEWLETHYGCNLRLVHRDDQIDECYDKQYKYINVVTGQ